jgi:hypothetical protein
MTPEEEAKIDWSLCTWEGSRRAQQQAFFALSLREKLEAVEEMADLARRFQEERKRKGLPYISVETGERVPGRQAGPPSLDELRRTGPPSLGELRRTSGWT